MNKKQFSTKPYARDFVGKIGLCQNEVLTNINVSGSHYVYIRDYQPETGMCLVSTFTSLEDRKGDIKLKKMSHIRTGKIYPVPKGEASFPLWSGLNKNTHRVHVADISQIGQYELNSRQQVMTKYHK